MDGTEVRALAHHHGDHDTARQLLLNAGGGNQPASIAHGRHLARQLDIFDDYASRINEQRAQLDDSTGIIGSRNALRAEITRRGWD